MPTVRVPDDGHPLPIAPAWLDRKEYVFRCPRQLCGKSEFALSRLEFLQRVVCEDCHKPMRVAEHQSLERYRTALAWRKKEIEKEIATQFKAGAAPPKGLSIVGITTCGKTAYLTSLYQAMLHGHGGFHGLADRGSAHDALLSTYRRLVAGQWVERTLDNLSFDVRADIARHHITLSVLEFSGERFKEIFFDQRQDHRHHEEILGQLRSSLGCIVLIDPDQLATWGQNYDRRAEFTAVKLIQMLASQNRHEHIVIALTKKNDNKALVDRNGSPEGFVRAASSLLWREVQRYQIPILHISAVSKLVEVMPSGEFHTRSSPNLERDSAEVLAPLQTLVKRIHPAYFAWIEEWESDPDGGAVISYHPKRRPAYTHEASAPIAAAPIASAPLATSPDGEVVPGARG